MTRSYPFRSVVIAMLLSLTPGLPARAEPEAPRGYLGVFVGPADGGRDGILVREVAPDSPASRDGLKKGDRVVKLGDGEVRDVEMFLQAVATKRPGDRLNLKIIRDGEEQSLVVTLGERPGRGSIAFPDLPGIQRPAFLGVQALGLTPELKGRLDVDLDEGAVVTEIVPNSPAARAGLRRDDVITAIDDRPVKSPTDLREAVQAAGPGKAVTLRVVRGTKELTIEVTLRQGTFGFFLTPGEDRFPTVDVESMLDQGHRVRELERRVEELEKRIRELEKK